MGVAILAVLLSMSGVAYAVDEWTGANIVNGSLTTADYANNDIQSVDIRDDTVSGGGLQSADIAPDAVISQEEIFGPVLAVIKVKDFDEGLKVANNTEYGLTGAIYSGSREALETARREYHVGNLYLNRKCTGAMVGAHPFGGFNMSGTDSKAGGPDYLLLFTQAKSVAEKL